MPNKTTKPLSVLRQKFGLVSAWRDVRVEPASGGFSGASVFKVENADTNYCLRRWPVGQTSSTRMLAIHHLLSLAHDCGVAVVPAPLKSDAGITLTEVDGEFWQLEPWMPGGADFAKAPSDEKLKSAMTQLARFHNAVCDWVPPTETQQWFQPASSRPCPTIGQRLRMIESYVASVSDFDAALTKESDTRFRDVGSQIAILFRTAHLKVRHELAAVAELPAPLQPCIRDLWQDHLLFQDDKLTGVVDFGAMATESVSCDLSRLLGSLFGDDFAAWQRGLRNYEAVRPMTEAEHRLLRPLDRSSVLLSGMTWLKRRYVLRNTPDDLSRVCDRLDSIVGRLTTLALGS
ncbi:MAG: phosphotransferase enzyme family protein [Planctomycetales bacterium]